MCDGRDQHKNKANAIKELTKRVNDFYRTGHNDAESETRREQFDDTKRRTYRVKDGVVIDHVTGKTTLMKNILRGKIELLS